MYATIRAACGGGGEEGESKDYWTDADNSDTHAYGAHKLPEMGLQVRPEFQPVELLRLRVLIYIRDLAQGQAVAFAVHHTSSPRPPGPSAHAQGQTAAAPDQQPCGV